MAAAVMLTSLLFLPVIALAQPAGYAAAYSRLGFGPRGMGMGNTLSSTAQDGIYSYYNPALTALAKKSNQIDLSTSAMSFDRRLNTLNATFKLPPSAGISIAILNASVSDIDGRDNSGYPTRILSTNEFQFLTAFGINIRDNLQFGTGIKLNLASYHKELSNAQSFGFDVGVLYHPLKNWSVALTIQDLLASYSWNSGDLYGGMLSSQTTDSFPVRFNFGNTLLIRDDLLMSITLGYLSASSENYRQLRSGLKFEAHQRISLRAGWQIDDLSAIKHSNRPSAGFSIHLPFDRLSPSVDYAFMFEPNQISAMHIFGLTFEI